MTQQNSAEQLEQALRNFDRMATFVRDDDGRQIWRFEFNGKNYLLHFYPRIGGISRFWKPGALNEFLGLQAMQRAGVAALRAVAHLSGFSIAKVKGDALIIESIAGAVPLDETLSAERIPQRKSIIEQVVQIIHDIGAAKLSHSMLKMEGFVVAQGKVYLSDARGLQRRGGFRLNDLFAFAHDATRFATRSDLLRAWNELNPDTMPPRANPRSRSLWRRGIRRTRRENSEFGLLRAAEWSGFFTKSSRASKPWSLASRLNVSRSDWEAAWPILKGQMDSGQLTPIKQDASGDVFSGEVIVAGRPVSVIVKRPRRKFRYRYVIDLFRTARAERMWIKAWTLIDRNLPCEWPMLVMRRRAFGYTTDAVIVFERVPGERLDHLDLDAIDPIRRDMLFRRAGRTLRAIERGGLVHYDSKSTNWIVFQDPARGAIPVMIDVDGIRPMNYWLVAWGILRLLRAMKNHPQYTSADSLALCQGFAPFARGNIQRENVSQTS